MNAAPITCLLFSDLSAIEREGISALVHYLETEHSAKVETREIRQKNVFKGAEGRGIFWIFAHRWESALASLRLPKGAKILVSTLSSVQPPAFLPALFLKSFHHFSENIHFMAHSPLSFRFLCEIRGLKQSQVSYLPLPVGAAGPKLLSRPDRVTVGVIARYYSDANLNYILNVAHYVAQKKTPAHFLLLGTGPLEKHLRNLVSELGLQSTVTLANPEVAAVQGLDVVLFSPLQNHHFIPIQLAASYGIPVIANEMPGIEKYLHDGRNGFVVAVNETKPMAELVLRLTADKQFRQLIGQKLQTHLAQTFSMDKLSRDYHLVLKGTPIPSKAFFEAA